MKETIEHNNRFYGEELKTESEQLKEWLIVANKEIERQKEVINGMIDNEEKYLLEINKLKSIIKEVREYIEKRKDTQNWRKESLKAKSTNIDIVLEHYRDILEILDKENI